MDSLTEEQRRRMEANRQAALAKCRERRNKTIQKENRDQSTVDSSAPSYSYQLSGYNYNNVATAAVSSSNGVVNHNGGHQHQRQNEVSCNNEAAPNVMNSLDDSRKRKIEVPQHQQQQQQQLTEEQRIRMETNRKRALEKKQKQQLMNTSNNNSTLSSSIPTDEQRARMEDNRRKALGSGFRRWKDFSFEVYLAGLDAEMRENIN